MEAFALRSNRLVVALVWLAALPLHLDEFAGIQLVRILCVTKRVFRAPRKVGRTNPPAKAQVGGLSSNRLRCVCRKRHVSCAAECSYVPTGASGLNGPVAHTWGSGENTPWVTVRRITTVRISCSAVWTIVLVVGVFASAISANHIIISLSDNFLAAHIRSERNRNINRAILVEVVLQKRD